MVIKSFVDLNGITNTEVICLQKLQKLLQSRKTLTKNEPGALIILYKPDIVFYVVTINKADLSNKITIS